MEPAIRIERTTCGLRLYLRGLFKSLMIGQSPSLSTLVTQLASRFSSLQVSPFLPGLPLFLTWNNTYPRWAQTPTPICLGPLFDLRPVDKMGDLLGRQGPV